MFKINKKSGFECGQKVKVYDDSSRLFYHNKPKNGRILRFNLPPGTYSANKPIKLKLPIEYAPLKLPKSQRNIPFKQLPEIHIGKNPNKASIIFEPKGRDRIIIDSNLYSRLNEIGRNFLVLHELAHYKYDGSPAGEIACDLYACQRMLLKGYNPSQLISIAHIVLNINKSSDRVKAINNQLLKLRSI